MHLFQFQCLPRQPFKRGKSLEEPASRPQRGPHAWCRKHKGSLGRRMVRPGVCGLRNPGPFPPGPKEERQ